MQHLKYKFLWLIIGLVGCPLLSKAQFNLNPKQQKWVDSVFKSLTPDEKIGQLLMPRANYNANYDTEKLKEWIKEYKIGGLVFFAGSPVKQAKLVNMLQENSRTPMMIGMDLEWGLAMRLDSTVRFPYQMSLGAMQGNDQLIQQMGQEIGRQCNRLGVHVSYAPVVDVNNNPNNPVINYRAFGENKYKVTEKALAYMKGLQSQNIITSAKHFPGHGDTGVDSHYDLPLITHPKERLDSVELYPYKQLIANGLNGTMIAHLSIPALDSTKNLASTLSKKIVTDLLKKELGFKGLIFTDAMDMKGATKFYPDGKANIMAILAGNDILETFIDVPLAYNAIKYALANKELSQKDIDDRVIRILAAKAWTGLNEYKPTIIKNLIEDLNLKSSEVLNQKLADNFVTIVQDKFKTLPIKNLNAKIATVALGTSSKTVFQEQVDIFNNAKHFFVTENTTQVQFKTMMDSLRSYDHVLLSVHGTSIRPANNYSIKPTIAEYFGLLAKQKNTIISLFTNTYVLGKLPETNIANTIILAYQESEFTQKTAAQVIFGTKIALGKLPVTVNSDFVYGQGINNSKTANILSETLAENLGLNSKLIEFKVDSIVNNAIAAKATPGAVVLAAKDGQIFFHKAYGQQTYGGVDVKKSDLYDLASITKISTSAPALMLLKDQGKFDLNYTMGQFIPSLAHSNKVNLQYTDVLTHQAKLKAWIPFWMNALDSAAMIKKSVVFKENYAKNYTMSFWQKVFYKKKSQLILDQKIADTKGLWGKTVNLSQQKTIWKNNTFSNTPTENYTSQVADSLWAHNNITNRVFNAILESPLREKKEYVYSDLNFYLLPNTIKNQTGQDFETFLKQNIFDKIGASTLCYNPINTFPLSTIVPTEYDSLYRKNLIHGRVHDEGASMLGGISGHAGLFGNAVDLAKLMQLYLQKGNYNNQQIIKPETIAQFTSYPFEIKENSRRGIIFDKPDRNKKGLSTAASASEASFGHSGFTGTYTWADPANGLVFVFLSNRVYPTRNNSKLSEMNVRTDLLEEFYKILKKQNALVQPFKNN